MVLREVDESLNVFSRRVIKTITEIKKRENFTQWWKRFFLNKIQNKNVNP